MKPKRAISETVIIAFVAIVDLASLFALFLCHQDVTSKEAQAAIEMQVHEAVSAKKQQGSAEMIRYSPQAINAMLHPDSDGKFRNLSHRVSASTDRQ